MRPTALVALTCVDVIRIGSYDSDLIHIGLVKGPSPRTISQIFSAIL
jgi:hypothetical protein